MCGFLLKDFERSRGVFLCYYRYISRSILDMNKSVVEKEEGLYVKLILIKIAEFFLFYVRNSFLVVAASFVFLALVVILTFYQDELNISPVKNVMLFVDNAPVIGNMIEMPTGHIRMEGDDFDHFFLRLSFYLTIFTEILRYIKIYVFKKDDKSNWKLLRKRGIFVISGISIIYSFSCIYVILSTGGQDAIWFFIIFFIFWIICCVASISFLFIDFIAKNIHKIIDRINITPINSVK